MVKKCSVLNCPIKARTKVGQFSFPVKRELCMKWIQACGRGMGFRPTLHSRICEIHFHADDFKPDEGRKRKRLKPGAVPSLNLGGSELTDDAQKIVAKQREAEVAALEAAKDALKRLKEEEDARRLDRESNPDPHGVVDTEATKVERPTLKPLIGVERLTERPGLKISVAQKLARNPQRLARIFRNEAVIEFFKEMSSLVASRRKRKSLFSFTICPLTENQGFKANHLGSTIDAKFVENLLVEAECQSNLGSKNRRKLPPWFRQGDATSSFKSHNPPPAELSRLKPVPVSKALHLLFDVGTPELPQPPDPLPPINAKLIFVNKSSINSSQNGSKDVCSDDSSANQVVKFEISEDLQPGPIAILDPNGLRKEVEHWRAQVDEMQKKNYDLEVQLARLKNDRRHLQLKVKTLEKARNREALVESKKKMKTTEKVSKMKIELAALRKFKKQVLNERGKKTPEAAVARSNAGRQELTTETFRKSIRVPVVQSSTPVDISKSATPQIYHLGQSDEILMSQAGGSATVIATLPPSADDSSATVMIPSETIYAEDDGEYQHIEIITMEMDSSGLEPTWRRIDPD